jgi:type IV secretion system protein VirB10
VVLVASSVVGLIIVVIVFLALLNRQQTAQAPKLPAKPSTYEVTGPNTPDAALRLQSTYAGVDRTPPTPPAPPPPPPEPKPMFPVAPVAPVQAPVFTAQAPVTPAFVPQPPPPPTPPAKPGQAEPVKPPAQPPKPKVSRYLFAKGDSVAKSPFSDPQEKSGSDKQMFPEKEEGKAGSLIKAAQWEKPADTTKVWYLSQAVSGQLAERVVSSIPGLVKIRVTRALEDKDLRGVVLIPQHSLIVAAQVGKPEFGTARLALDIKQIELSDGSILSLKGTVGDQTGATGVAGHVDNHVGRVLLGATLSALLSVGTRLPTGNTTGFVPTIGQDVTQNLSQDVSQTGRQIVKRELDVAPTLTLEAGTPVLIHPNDNISFAHGPKGIR